MSKRILVAENDPDILHLLTLILNEAGYEVQSVPGGTPIVEKKIDLPDLFILDKDMPLIDGLALCKYLKVTNETKNIPIIMISAYHKIKEKAKEIGIDEFLEKPFNVSNLLQTIQKYVPDARPGMVRTGTDLM
jgi:CheY-like chemotaxis protein